MEASKTCKRCGESKSLESYYKSPRGRLQRKSICIPCTLSQQASRRKSDPESAKRHREAVARYRQRNPEKVRERQQRWRKTKPYRDYMLQRNYQMTREQYDLLLESQGGTCALCPATSGDATGRPLAVDHDHTCCPGSVTCGKCVRGLLCTRCNKYWVGPYEALPKELQDWTRINAYLHLRKDHD